MTNSELEFDKFLDFLVRNAKKEAYREFADRLCDGKVSNDKTVIEANVLLKEMVGEEL